MIKRLCLLLILLGILTLLIIYPHKMANQDSGVDIKSNIPTSSSDQLILDANGNIIASLDKTGLVIRDGSNVKRLLAGRDSAGNVKIKLSQPTFDVLSASDNQLIWSSDFNSFKILETGTVTLTGFGTGSGGQLLTFNVFTGSYNFIPSIIGFWETGSVRAPLPFFDFSTNNGNVGTYLSIYAVATTGFQINAGVADTSGGDSQASLNNTKVRYYVMREVAST